MRLLSLDSLTPEDLGAWERLADEAAEPNPFFEPAFVRPAVAALGAADVRLLVDGENGAWRGCLPVSFAGAPLGPRLLASWKHPYSFLGTPLVAGSGTDGFAEALASSMLDRDPSAFLMLRRASVGPVLAAIRAVVAATPKLSVVFEQPMERAALERRGEPDYLSGMKSRRRSELKRQKRKLGEELGDEPVAREWTDIEAATEEFLRLEASGWKGEGGTALASQEGSAHLFREMCASFGERGRIRFRSLDVGDRTTAMTCDIVGGEVLFGFKAAYDESLRRFSPGVQLQADNFTAFHERGSERAIDSCGEPANEAMRSLWPDRRAIATVAFGRRGPTGWALGRALDAANRSRSRRGREPSRILLRPR